LSWNVIIVCHVNFSCHLEAWKAFQSCSTKILSIQIMILWHLNKSESPLGYHSQLTQPQPLQGTSQGRLKKFSGSWSSWLILSSNLQNRDLFAIFYRNSKLWNLSAHYQNERVQIWYWKSEESISLEYQSDNFNWNSEK
jgi:hypothetical protein